MERLGWEGLGPARMGSDGVMASISTNEHHREMMADRPTTEEEAQKQAGMHLNPPVEVPNTAPADAERKFEGGRPAGLETK